MAATNLFKWCSKGLPTVQGLVQHLPTIQCATFLGPLQVPRPLPQRRVCPLPAVCPHLVRLRAHPLHRALRPRGGGPAAQVQPSLPGAAAVPARRGGGTAPLPLWALPALPSAVRHQGRRPPCPVWLACAPVGCYLSTPSPVHARSLPALNAMCCCAQILPGRLLCCVLCSWAAGMPAARSTATTRHPQPSQATSRRRRPRRRWGPLAAAAAAASSSAPRRVQLRRRRLQQQRLGSC